MSYQEIIKDLIKENKKLKKATETYLTMLCFRWNARPKFKIGDTVRVRLDADSIVGKWYNFVYEKWEHCKLIAGFDDVREPTRGFIGRITDIRYSKARSEPQISGFDYQVSFIGKRGKHSKIYMMEEWLQKARRN